MFEASCHIGCRTATRKTPSSNSVLPRKYFSLSIRGWTNTNMHSKSCSRVGIASSQRESLREARMPSTECDHMQDPCGVVCENVKPDNGLPKAEAITQGRASLIGPQPASAGAERSSDKLFHRLCLACLWCAGCKGPGTEAHLQSHHIRGAGVAPSRPERLNLQRLYA